MDAYPNSQPVCPACGYSLKDLPIQGACPECGGAYTPVSLAYAEKPGERKRMKTAWLAVLLPVVVLLPIWAARLFTAGATMAVVALVILVFPAVVLSMSVVRAAPFHSAGRVLAVSAVSTLIVLLISAVCLDPTVRRSLGLGLDAAIVGGVAIVVLAIVLPGLVLWVWGRVAPRSAAGEPGTRRS